MAQVAAATAAGDAPAAPSRRRFHRCHGGCGLGRLVRRLRRRTRCLRAATARSGSAPSGGLQQYDPLSYARNFDANGFGSGADDDELGHFSYTFSSRFVAVAAKGRAVLAAAGAAA